MDSNESVKLNDIAKKLDSLVLLQLFKIGLLTPDEMEKVRVEIKERYSYLLRPDQFG